MKLRIKSIPLGIPMCMVFVFLFLGQCSFAHAGKNGATYRKLPGVGPLESKSTNGKQKYTYVAKIKNEKHDEVTTQDEDTSGSDGEIYVKTEEINSNSAEWSSSSEEIENKVTIKNSTTTNSKLKGILSSGQNKKIQTKPQHTRFVRQPQADDKSHNWYVYKNSVKGRNMGAISGSKDGQESSFDGGGDGSGTGGGGGSGGGSGGGGSKQPGSRSSKNTGGSGGQNGVGASAGERNPYKVRRAKLGDIVDPEGFNFFQFKPTSRIGWLWINFARKNARRDKFGDLLDDDNGDEDGDPSNLYDWEFRRYDRACLYLEYLKQKSDAEVPVIPEEIKRIVDGQNELLARKFLDWQFTGKETPKAIALQDNENHPLRLSFAFLELTMKIFRDKICRNATSYANESAASAPLGAISRSMAFANTVDMKFLPESFVEDIFLLFLTLREITLTKNIPDYPNDLDEEEIYKEILLKCEAEEEAIEWFSHSCGDQLLSYTYPNNFACVPLADYGFNSMLYDPILDGMWHMFTAVHAYCFRHFQINTRLWHKYSLIIANTFTNGMRQRWKASTVSQKFYTRLLGPDHEVHLETMNRCMFASTLRSNVPALLPRFDTLSPVTFGYERMIHKDGVAASPDA